MKIESKTRDVQTSGLAEVSNFRIKVTGKAFRILLDGLYANKIKAILREYGTNAYDAHLAVGKGDVPFDVQLPTSFDPTFRVRDYGCSMTHEQVMGQFSTLFDSSKDDRNDQVGMLGLGSKSGFSYVDQMTITTWLDGVQRTYNAFINSDDVPCIVLMGEEPSPAPTGTEISLTANARDTQAFADNAAQVYRWFVTKPNITGNQITYPDLVPISEGKGWRLYQGRQSHASARQGCVAYPLDPSSIPGIPDEIRALLHSNLVIDFPVGTLDVQPSREGLSYGETTCRNVVARLNAIKKEIVEQYGEDITKAPTLWEAGKVYRDLASSSLPESVVDFLRNIPWKNGKSLRHGITGSEVLHEAAKVITPPAGSSDRQYEVYLINNYRARNVKSFDFDFTARRRAESSSLYFGSETLFFVRITDKKPTYEGIRIRNAWDEACKVSTPSNNTPNASYAYSSYGKHHYRTYDVILISAEDEATADKILEIYGNPPFTYTHTLPPPVIKQRTVSATRQGVGKTKRTEVKVKEWDSTAHTWSQDKVVPLDGDATYFFVNGNAWVNSSEQKTIGIYEQVFEEILGIVVEQKRITLDHPVYAISTTYAQRMASTDHKWELLTTHVEQCVPTLVKKMEEEELIRVVRELTYGSTLTRLSCDALDKVLAAYPSSPLAEYYRIKTNYDGMAKPTTPSASADLNVVNRVIKKLDVYTRNEEAREKANKSPDVLKLKDLINDTVRRYTLLSIVTNIYNAAFRDGAVAEYIEAIEFMHMNKGRAKEPESMHESIQGTQLAA